MYEKHVGQNFLGVIEKNFIIRETTALVFTLVGIIFFLEISIMFFIGALPSLSQRFLPLINAALLIMLLFPVFYILVLRLIKNNIIPFFYIKKELIHQTARYRTILDSVDFAIIIANSAGIVIGWNHSAEEIFGYARAEIIGQPLMYLMPHRYRDLHQIAFNRVMLNDKRKPTDKIVELDGLHKSGNEVTVGLSLIKWQDEGEWFVTGVIRNIIKRKQPNISLRMATAIFESSDAKIITDANQVIYLVNKAFTKITGYNTEDVVGKTTAMLKSGYHDVLFYKDMQEKLSKYGSWQGEIWNQRKNGERYLAWLSISSVLNDEGNITSYIGTLSDITVSKLLEKEWAFRDTFIG